MKRQGPQREIQPQPPPEYSVAYASHDVRLSWREWIVAAALVGAVLGLLPGQWERRERFQPGEDYRIPYELGNDYWLFGRYGWLACSQNKTLLIGDSVIWGHYVTKEHTLSHYLNAFTGEQRFANLGVDGIHPAALAGLLEYYGRGISNSRVILHCNPLWMASPEHDLQQAGKDFRLNHPALLPQLVGSPGCYTAPYSDRLGTCVERVAPFRNWARHLRAAYFENADLPEWTVRHPYDSPIQAVRRGLPSPGSRAQGSHLSWQARGIVEHDFPWVRLPTSLQWKSFQRAVRILRARGNRVFVLVGPFNEHMLEKASLATYTNRKGEIQDWLRQNDIPHYVPPALPSQYCADASHPLSEGYALLAAELLEQKSFIRFDTRPAGRRRPPPASAR